MKLSPRLKAIVDYVENNSFVADIGTDHAYIPVYLVENNISKKVIASDVNKGPLENAKKYVDLKRLSHRINLRLGDGIKILKPNEVDTVIIAGMGGLLIKKILEEGNEIAETIDNFILQPMIASDELRKYLIRHNYKIIDEKLVKEGDKIYEIMLVRHGKDNISDEIYFEIGEKLVENKDPLLKELIQKKLREIENILQKIRINESIKAQEKLNIIKIKYDKLKGVLKSIDC
ncbi:SAM-dependent methyltransferase [Caloranaerobacter azorensis H53214]|uniref:SAM-dependent methyltransferase n=1 Tax=Caloranaerobacter azorensis H53214 TaxID=1156417 RepID=A0A096BFI7_9FIRM|nr:class I SAM-dependent methyltransferase [Caloranaerobacter azorensis]KGG79488.1 SAM-dependent methyltransferase [Caloranaerobacter azorensis H53214]